MTEIVEGGGRRARPYVIPESWVEWTCKVLSELALLIMLVLIAIDIVTRSVFHFSFEISDEIGGYMLVAITFFSLAVCHVNGSFHEVEFVQARLSERGRTVSRLIFGVMALFVCGLLTWQFWRFAMSSWRFGDEAPTLLATPLWLPKMSMFLGMAALCFAICRTLIADVRRLRHPASDPA
jgi:TRAP-type C4-dicarboxylate transport system permease small subunit